MHSTDKETKVDGITLVTGLPRSGTSVMMQMLAAGGLPPLTDNVRAPDSDNPRGYYEFELVKKTKKDASWIASAPGKAVKMVHLLLYDLPPDRDYRIIFMKRDLKEVVASQGVMLKRLGKEGASLSEAQLIEVYKEQLRQIEGWLLERPNLRVLMVNYNELIREPEPVVEAINQFVGGRLEVKAMQKTIDRSLYRQRC